MMLEMEINPAFIVKVGSIYHADDDARELLLNSNEVWTIFFKKLEEKQLYTIANITIRRLSIKKAHN